MNILGLIEMHPFDGTQAFICLRIQGPNGLFDFPITTDQLELLTANMATPEIQEEEEDSYDDEEYREYSHGQYEPTNSSFVQPNDDDSPIVLPQQQYAMGHRSSWDEDDDL